MTRYCTKCGAVNDDLAQYCTQCQAPLGPVSSGYQPMQSVHPGAVTDWKALGADKKVTNATDTFAPTDTMYVSVDTSGSGTAKLDAKWTYHKGTSVAVVKEDSMTLDTTGPATHEFHVSKPDGWPAGNYEVEVMLDGKSVGTKKFTVK